MKRKLSEIISALILSLILLIILDVFSTTIIPSIGMGKIKLNFSVLFILFLSFYIESPLLALFILFSQFAHSIFTIEGWAFGTFTGVISGIIISQLKDVLNFNSHLTTILISFFYQFLWFGIMSLLIYIKAGNRYPFWESFMNFLPESFILSLFAPFFFSVLKNFWRTSGQESSGDQVNV